MSSITDDFVEYYDKTMETLVSKYNRFENNLESFLYEIFRYVYDIINDNLMLFSVLLIILLLVLLNNVSPTTTYNIVNFIDTNLSIIFATIVMTLIFYILYVFFL